MPSPSAAVAAREALAAKISSPEEKREDYWQVGTKTNADRVVLRAEDARALGEAYRLLAKIADRLPDPVGAD